MSTRPLRRFAEHAVDPLSRRRRRALTVAAFACGVLALTYFDGTAESRATPRAADTGVGAT